MKRFLSFVLPFVLSFLVAFAAHGSTTNISGAARISGDISPSQLTAQTDNWNPTGLSGATVIRVSTDASRDLTGLAGGYDGRLIVIHNVGAQNLVLKDASGSSSAANRFALTGDVTLAADAVALLQYDGTTSVWRLVGGSGSGTLDSAFFTGTDWTDLTDSGATTLHKHDHGGMDGLSDDDHSQYAFLAGRSGGQTFSGGTAASNNLELQSTAHATEGEVQVKNSDAFRIYDADDTESLYFSVDGVGNFGMHNTANDLEIHSVNDILLIPAGADVKVWSSDGVSGHINLTHATDGTISTSAGDIFFHPNGGNVRVYDTGPTNYLDLSHNGTDGILATNTGDLKLNPSTGAVGINQSSPAFGLDILVTGSAALGLTSTDAAAVGPAITSYHNSASPAAGDNVWRIITTAKDNGGTQRNLAKIAVLWDDTTSTTMDSSMQFAVMDNVNAAGFNKTATLTSLGVWTDASLAEGKTFEGKLPDVLDKVKNLRIEKYRSSNVPANSPDLATAERHYSCTAEDFYAVFGLGKDPSQTHTDENGNTYKTGGIAPKDAAFLALDCIQKLIAENEALKARVAALEAAKP